MEAIKMKGNTGNGRKYLQIVLMKRGFNIQTYENTHNSISKINKSSPHDPIKTWAEDLNRHFSKESLQTANGSMKRCSASLIMKEMGVKTTMSCQLTPVIRTMGNSECWPGCGENRTLMLYWWKCKLAQPLWKIVWRFIKTLKIGPPHGLTYGTLYEEYENTNLKRCVSPHVHSSIIYNCQDTEKT